MTHNHQEVRRYHWLIRYYRAQLRFELRVLTARPGPEEERPMAVTAQPSLADLDLTDLDRW